MFAEYLAGLNAALMDIQADCDRQPVTATAGVGASTAVIETSETSRTASVLGRQRR